MPATTGYGEPVQSLLKFGDGERVIAAQLKRDDTPLPAETPMVFEGKTVTELCAQLKDPACNGRRNLAMLLEHVSHDPLVLWGWAPGGKRTTTPLPHDKFVAAFATWIGAEGACP